MKKFSIQKSTFPSSSIISGGTKGDRVKTAEQIASILFCTATDAPCGVCGPCVKLKAGSHPDFFMYGVDEPIKVDQAREIKSAAEIMPNEAEQSIFIIDSCDGMNPQTQNALLKVLEEPKNAYFLLLCGNGGSLLETIRSRCQVFSLGDHSDGDGVGQDILTLATQFVVALKDSELAISQVMTRAAALERSLFSTFCTACQQELHRELTSGSTLNTKAIIDIYQFFHKTQDDLKLYPNIYGLAMNIGVTAWELIRKTKI